jgi:putative ATPase
MGYGRGYRYAHDEPEHFAAMQNLPDRLRGSRYYEPSDQGFERGVAERLRRWWGERRGAEKGGDRA